MKINKVNVSLLSGNIPIRTIELSTEDWELIQESIKFYCFNMEKVELDMLDNGSNRMRVSARLLRKNLLDIMDKIG